MRGKIFISYRRDDSASLALGICQFLERQFGRNNVFIDVDMQAGAKFPDLLERRLGECKILLALIGPRWLDARDDAGNRRLDDPNDWVRLEIARALKRGITVIPVRVEGANLPKKSTSPADIQRLLDNQAAVVTTAGFSNEMAGLAHDIRPISNHFLKLIWIAGAVSALSPRQPPLSALRAQARSLNARTSSSSNKRPRPHADDHGSFESLR